MTLEEMVERSKDVLHEHTNICAGADTCDSRWVAERVLEAAGVLELLEQIEKLKRSQKSAWEWEQAAHESRERLLAERNQLIDLVGDDVARATLLRGEKP